MPPADDAHRPAFFRRWWVAMRTFALPASTMSVIFGTTLAVTLGGAKLNWPLFLAALFGMAILHTGANLLNDVYDFKKGIDRQVNPVSGAVVRGWIAPAQARTAAWLFLGAGMLIGLYLVIRVGPPVLWIGLLGVFIGVSYTWGPFPLKFNALGDLAVFLNFGVLGALGAWTVQTGRLSWVPVFWAIPMSLLVVAILHANNWRDIRPDTAAGTRTMASVLGDARSETYYGFLLFGPFAVTLLILAASRLAGWGPPMPLTFLIVAPAFPLALKLWRKGRRRHQPEQPLDFVALDGATAQLNLLFSVLATVGLLLSLVVQSNG